MNRAWLPGLLGLILLSGCGGWLPGRRLAPGMPMNDRVFQREFASNGERIYLTATNQDGEYIEYTGGPGFGGMMMGAYLTCAACHGSDGRGGVHSMHMQVMDAPDIRYQSLSGEAGEHGHEDHGDGHGDYTLEDFRRAVVEGEHPGGEALSRDMPRWQLSDHDLADLLAYLKSFP